MVRYIFKDGVKPISVKPISVHFIGEQAADSGGPTREYFSLLFDDIKKYLMCTGSLFQFTFVHDLEKLKNGDYYLFGNLVAMSLLSGCAGPRCLMPSVVAKVLCTEHVSPSIEDIPDLEIQNKLKELQEAQDEVQFESILQTFPERLNAGVTKVRVKFERAALLENVCTHYCISACIEEIQDFVKGLQVIGVHQILIDHHEESKHEFLLGNAPKAEDFLKIFQHVQ